MGLTRLRAEQISDIDYKQAVRVISVANVTLAGGAPSQVDGVNLSIDDRILVNGQTTASQNGIYQVDILGTGSNGTWIRSLDTNATGELEAGTIVMVTEGTVYKDTQWKLTTNNPIIIGTTPLTFEQNSAFAFGNVYANGIGVLADTVGDVLTLSAGNNIQITGNNTNKSVTIAVTGISLNSISNGTSNVNVVSSGGNVTVGVAGTNNVAVFAPDSVTFAANLLPAANVTYSLGSNTARWKDLWISNTTIYIGDVALATHSNALTINGANVMTGNAGANFSTTGNVIGGNVTTDGVITATGNITGGNLLTSADISAGGNISGANFLTTGLVSTTGNVAGSNLVVTGNIYDASTLTIVTGTGDIQLQPASGNIVLTANTYINNVAQPVQNQDAATKSYVDNAVSTAISYHEPVAAATTDTLAAITGGTITYNQPGGAGNGIGATLTTTGSFDLIDTANVQTANTRILVKNEANSALNGVYVWSNATVITRSSDADTYGSGNALALGLNDYFFVSGGNVNKGSAFVVNAPTGTITFGTSNITFAQFSASQTFTANTSAGISLAGTVINAKVDGVTTAFDGSGNIAVKTSANLTTPNIGAATGTSLSTTGNIDAGNLRTAGLITSTGNIDVGNVRTAGVISASGNITGGNLIGNTNAFKTISVVGQSNVVATTANQTVTFAAGTGLAVTTDAANNTVTISSVATDSIFATGGDMGTVTEAVTASEDLGDVDSAVSVSYDLGSVIDASGLVYPSQLVLPTYTPGTLPAAAPAGQFIYLSTSTVGAMTAFSDGTNWRFTSSGNVVS